MRTIPKMPWWLKLITLIYGVFTFVWLSAEDSIWLVSVIGFGFALLCVLHGVFKLHGRTFAQRLWIPATVGLGALTGAGASLATALIMLMKTSLHGHLYPDYPFLVVAGIIERLPAWTIAGALVGAAIVLLCYQRRGEVPDPN
jgi:hypothetical protein